MTALAAAVPRRALPGACALLAGCEGPLSLLDPAGPSAATAASLWWGMFGWFAAVLLVVMALWLIAVHRAQRADVRDHHEDGNVSGRRDGDIRGNRWIVVGGVLLPLATVIVILLFGIPAGHRMQAAPGTAPVVVEVTGHQWWWQVRYPDQGIETANHLVIPAGQRVHLDLGTGDVIHSFWVPRLAGKLDMIPGRRHLLAVEAAVPGLYRAQCAEFCGAQHARMQMVVEALEPEAYAQWLASRAEPAIPSPPAATLAVFREHCGDCHRVAGLTAGDRGSGPDLSDLATRPSLGAGTLPLTGADSIHRWLRDHQQLKPGNRMPAPDDLDDEQLTAIARWLATLDAAPVAKPAPAAARSDT